MDAKAEKIALFRYGLIAPLVLEPLPRGELTRRAPGDRRPPLRDPRLPAHVGFRQYLAGLGSCATAMVVLKPWPPKLRRTAGSRRTITPQLADLIERLKRENPHRTGTTLLRELALVSGQNEPALSAATLYRFLKQCGLSKRQLLAPPAHKEFDAQHSNQIWQSDTLF